jgi:hypothetical protein
VIDRDTYERTRARLADNPKPQRTTGEDQALLGNKLLRCGKCRCVMWAIAKRKGKPSKRQGYECSHRTPTPRKRTRTSGS